MKFGVNIVGRVDENLCFFVGKHVVINGDHAGGLCFSGKGFSPVWSVGEEADEDTELGVRLVVWILEIDIFVKYFRRPAFAEESRGTRT